MVCYTSDGTFLSYQADEKGIYREVYRAEDGALYAPYRALAAGGDYLALQNTETYARYRAYRSDGEGGSYHCYTEFRDNVIYESTPFGYLVIDVVTGQLDMNGLRPLLSPVGDAYRYYHASHPTDAAEESIYMAARALTDHMICFVMEKEWLDGADIATEKTVDRFLTTLCLYDAYSAASRVEGHPYAKYVSQSEDGGFYVTTGADAQTIAWELFGYEAWAGALYPNDGYDAERDVYRIPNGLGLGFSDFSYESMRVTSRRNFVYVEFALVKREGYEDVEDISYGTYQFVYEYIPSSGGGAHLRFVDFKRTLEVPIATYGALSEFLNDEQLALYEDARELIPLFHGNSDGINYLHAPEGMKFEQRERYRYNGTNYASAVGVYQNYEEFRALCLEVFTEAYWNTLCQTDSLHPTFLAHDGRLYAIDADKGGAFGYDPDDIPDTYELISRTDTEIRFNVIAHYKSSYRSPIYSVSTDVFPITLVRGEEGWRFSAFADPAISEGRGYYLTFTEYTSYFGKRSVANLMVMPVLDGQKQVLLRDWLAENELSPTAYAVVDLNGDAGDEMVFWLARHGDDAHGFLILEGSWGNVRMHYLWHRALQDLKTDGTFSFSGGVSHNGIGTLSFADGTYAKEELAWRSEQEGTLFCYIGEEAVSKEEYEAFLGAQAQKTDVAWHTLSPDALLGQEYAYEVPLASGERAMLCLRGNDPAYFAEVYTAELDGSGVPNTVVLHRASNGTGMSHERAYVFDGRGVRMPLPTVYEVLSSHVAVRGTEDAWILTVSGKDYRIDKAQFSDYPEALLHTLPRWVDVWDFSLVDGALVCEVGILCAGNGTGFAREHIYIRYAYEAGSFIAAEVWVE